METVPQTGLIVVQPRMSDYKTTGVTGIQYLERIVTGYWDIYRPKNEAQHKFYFDTMSCTTFSALNAIETQCNWMLKEKKSCRKR